VDIALWDIKGKQLGQPVWKLLGGYSATVPAYITFGLLEYTREQLVEAVGDQVELMIDANYLFSFPVALDLAKRIEPPLVSLILTPQRWGFESGGRQRRARSGGGCVANGWRVEFHVPMWVTGEMIFQRLS
jgi:L-alanine-DL-glutamate epimerase-like enolase superfamily enzyme